METELELLHQIKSLLFGIGFFLIIMHVSILILLGKKEKRT